MGETVKILAGGDGYIAFNNNNGDDEFLTIFEINAPNGYPKYFSYLLDEEVNRKYHAAHGSPWLKRTTMRLDQDDKAWRIDSESRERTLPQDGVYYHESYAYPHTTIAVFSDGVASFTCDGQPINPIDIITNFMSFKNYKGEFIKRRVKSALKSFKNMGWKHYDDVSMAAIHIEDL